MGLNAAECATSRSCARPARSGARRSHMRSSVVLSPSLPPPSSLSLPLLPPSFPFPFLHLSLPLILSPLSVHARWQKQTAVLAREAEHLVARPIMTMRSAGRARRAPGLGRGGGEPPAGVRCGMGRRPCAAARRTGGCEDFRLHLR